MNSVDGYLAFLVERNFRIEGKISGGNILCFSISILDPWKFPYYCF